MPALNTSCRNRAIEIEVEQLIENMVEGFQLVVEQNLDNEVIIQGQKFNLHQLRDFFIQKLHDEHPDELRLFIASLERTVSTQLLTRQPAIRPSDIDRMHNVAPEVRFIWQDQNWQDGVLKEFQEQHAHRNNHRP